MRGQVASYIQQQYTQNQSATGSREKEKQCTLHFLVQALNRRTGAASSGARHRISPHLALQPPPHLFHTTSLKPSPPSLSLPLTPYSSLTLALRVVFVVFVFVFVLLCGELGAHGLQHLELVVVPRALVQKLLLLPAARHILCESVMMCGGAVCA